MNPIDSQKRWPPSRWSDRLVDEVDWVAQVWDWQKADQLTGQLLSFILPLEDWFGQRPMKGPVLIAGKRQSDGPDRIVLLTTREELSPARLDAAHPLDTVRSASLSGSSAEIGLVRDLTAFGALELIKREEVNGNHALGEVLQEFPLEALVTIAIRPSLLKAASLPTALKNFLPKNQVLAIALEDWAQRMSLSFFVPMSTAEAETRGKELRTAANDYLKNLAAQPMSELRQFDLGSKVLMRLAPRLMVWPRRAPENDGAVGLRGRVDLSTAEVPNLLANVLSFPNPQAVLDAYAYANKNGYWTLYLATLSHSLRLTTMLKDFSNDRNLAAANVFYHFEPLWERDWDAGYRLRVREDTTNIVLKDLRLDLAKEKGGNWSIDWLGAYGSSRTSEIRLQDAVEPPYQWRILSLEDGAEVAVIRGQWASDPLPGGTYVIALQRFSGEGREVFFPRPIEHGAGMPMRLAIQTAIELKTASLSSLSRWEVVRASQPETVIQWQTGNHSVMLVPGGLYKVAITCSPQEGEKILWPVELDVNKGSYAVLELDSSLTLQIAEWVPPRDPNHGWWGAVRTGETPNRRINWTKVADQLLLPPDKYDVYWVQGYEQQARPLLIARSVELRSGKVATVSADAGIRLEVADWVPPRDPNHGWWGAVRTGDVPDHKINWTKTGDKLLLPPGKYDVYWVQDYDHQAMPLLVASAVEVKENTLITVPVKSGLRLKLPQNTPALDANNGWWGIVGENSQADDRIHWSKGRSDQPLFAAPGVYDVVWKQDYEHQPEKIKHGVMITENELVDIEVYPAGRTKSAVK